ncbi:hypothetical protein ABE28_008950 [Peribacillus muralis]|uniref:DUF4355 domain-containing protein n=1 Tax=Peribacillus muralis TaxID=264697 RepID=A0A1B3XMN6_9BACI|nr:DUF4355 domain-containing protein [Peribacillus muralis]AOH54479.1 hypothetical protein ABE28_008950 [Peribacillus muralis]
MNLEDIRSYLVQNKDNQDVREFVNGLNPVTIDRVKDFATVNDDGRNWLQSQKDSFFSSSLDTWKKNNLDEVVMGKVKELYPEETEEQKRIRLLEQKLEEAEKKEQRETLRNKALSLATEKELPTSLVDFFLGEDEEKTIANLAKLEDTFNPYIESKVEQRFKDTGRKFQKGSNGDNSIATDIAKQRNEQQQTSQNNAWG